MRLDAGIAGKARRIPAEPLGTVVARGEAQLGFQQPSELTPVPGIAIVDPIPEQAQKMTLYSGAVAATGTQPQAAPAPLDHLASGAAAKAIAARGLAPLASRGP